MQTAYSPADLRRQKTVWANGSAKADDADSAEKDCWDTEGDYAVLHITIEKQYDK